VHRGIAQEGQLVAYLLFISCYLEPCDKKAPRDCFARPASECVL
jgi:hypothetical protein